MITSINPATGAEIERFAFHTAGEVDAALTNAVQAQAQWCTVPVD